MLVWNVWKGERSAASRRESIELSQWAGWRPSASIGGKFCNWTLWTRWIVTTPLPTSLRHWHFSLSSPRHPYFYVEPNEKVGKGSFSTANSKINLLNFLVKRIEGWFGLSVYFENVKCCSTFRSEISPADRNSWYVINRRAMLKFSFRTICLFLQESLIEETRLDDLRNQSK